MPIGAIVAKPHLWQSFIDAPFLHTSTFGGNPLACAAAIAAIKVTQDENLCENAAVMGNRFVGALREMQVKYPGILAEVRGQGLIIGLEFTHEGYAGFAISELVNNKILAAYTLNNPKVIRIEPPLVITASEVERAIGVWEKIIASAGDLAADL